MKTEIVGELTQEQEIDWSKPMIVESENFIVATTGNHEEHKFEAFVLHDKNDKNFVLRIAKKCVKEAFKPITHPITIKFSNE